MSHQFGAINQTLYFGFVSNDTSGSAVDGTTPLFDVRLGGATASAAPVLSGTPTLLTHANYGPGCYEVAVAATTGNGFAAGNTYLVFVTVTADSQTPGSCLGSFTLDPVPANLTEINGASTSVGNLEDDYDGTGYNKSNSTIGTTTTNSDMRGTDSAYTGTPPTAATVAAAVWDLDATSHQTGGTFGEALGDPVGSGNSVRDLIGALNDVSSADVNSACDTAISDASLATASALSTVDTAVDAIKAKTDSLTFTNSGEVDANIQSINDAAVSGDGSATPWDAA